jgi:beta-mannosidase
MKISLNGSDWLFKGFYGEDWRWRNAHKPGSRDHTLAWFPATVPGSVQHDLFQAGEISNPYFERNSLLSEWVCQRSWVYRKHFTADAALEGKRIRLVFQGVDYEAEFFLNGELLGSHRGMYTPAAFEIGSKLHFGADNMISVAIAEAPHEQPQVGRTSLVRTQKARMNYWWDFSPRMVHQGIWDSVDLEVSGPAVLSDVFIRPQLSDNLDHAIIHVECTMDSTQSVKAEIEVVLKRETQTVTSTLFPCNLSQGSNTCTFDIQLDEIELWWPNGQGSQLLYTAEVSLLVSTDDNKSILSDETICTFGLRRIRFVENEGASAGALPYTLEVNGRRIYINGWNWVPIDTLYGVERPQKLTHLLTLAQKAHVNLLRVWGGGLIEKQAFYNLCDRLGILIWQEFIQSSSGIDNDAPTDPEFIQQMVAEARQIVPRRRNHPALALWCGGNELMSSAGPIDDRHPMLAALKAAVNELDPDRHWLPTSASGPSAGNSLEAIEKDPDRLHDVHGPWEYQGLTQQYTLYNRGSSLLHSEFGVEGITNPRTLNATIAPEHQQPVSLANPNWFHLGAWWVWPEKWNDIFGGLADIDQSVRLVQFLQFEGLRYAVEADRRRWPHNSGTIPWQFNEPYPMAACTSAVDYYAEPKPAYYAVQAAYRPLSVTARYPTLVWKDRENFEAEIWASYSDIEPLTRALLTCRLIALNGKVYFENTKYIQLLENRPILLEVVSILFSHLEHEELFFLDLSITAKSRSDLRSDNRYLFSRSENLSGLKKLPQTVLSTNVVNSQNSSSRQIQLRNAGTSTAMYVWLEAQNDLGQDDYLYFSENYFCLFPGEERIIEASWLEGASYPRALKVEGWNFPESVLML